MTQPFPPIAQPTGPDTIPHLDEGQLAYAAGFLLDSDDHVLLIRKQRPTWQAGRLNGVGGKVDPGETPREAMRREFREEAQLDVDTWEHFLTLTFPAGAVWFFRATDTTQQLRTARAGTDEPLEIHAVSELLTPGAAIIPNLRWILPLAAYTHDRYAAPVVHEVHEVPQP